MLDFFSIGRKIQNIFLNIFPIHFQLIVSQTSLIKFLLYPLEQESSVTFACLTFLLYSFRLDRIFTLHSLLYQDRLYTFSLFFVIIYFASLLSSCTLPAQRFELWTLKLRVSCSTKLSYTGDFQDLSCNAPDVIRTRDIRVKSPLPYRLATDANQYSVFGISPSVFVLSFSLSLTPFFIFLFFICPRHKCREHQLMRRDLNPQTLRLTAERATYCATHQYFFTGKNFTRQSHTAITIC